MRVNNKEYNIDELLKDMDLEKDMLHDYGNGLLLSDKHISILNRYNINYKKYNNINNLLFDIEEYLNDNGDLDNDDLEWVSSDLSERNYYQNTKK